MLDCAKNQRKVEKMTEKPDTTEKWPAATTSKYKLLWLVTVHCWRSVVTTSKNLNKIQEEAQKLAKNIFVEKLVILEESSQVIWKWTKGEAYNPKITRQSAKAARLALLPHLCGKITDKRIVLDGLGFMGFTLSMRHEGGLFVHNGGGICGVVLIGENGTASMGQADKDGKLVYKE